MNTVFMVLFILTCLGSTVAEYIYLRRRKALCRDMDDILVKSEALYVQLNTLLTDPMSVIKVKEADPACTTRNTSKLLS